MAECTGRKILIPVDGSENSQRAFDFCVENMVKPDDTLLLVHITSTPHLSNFSLTEPLTLPTEEWHQKMKGSIEKTQKMIGHYESICESKKLKKKSFIEGGKPGEAICKLASQNVADMIVMGSRGLNALRRTFTGSVSDYVLHHTHIPVTIVPPKQ